MEYEVTFLTEDEGGRSTGVPILSGNVYRPLLVVGDPNARTAVRGPDNPLTEDYLEPFFESGPADARLGEPLTVTIVLPFWSQSSAYAKLNAGVTFTLREGSKIVGHGTVLRWLSPAPEPTPCPPREKA
jgi:hypothetical protein